jgi:hypothetical protein
MIIQLHGTTEQVAAARRSLETLATSWGHTLTDAPTPAPQDQDHHGPSRGIDPLAAASLALSLPSAALAVADLADRIRKRRRAKQLTDCARHLATQHVTATLTTTTRTTEISGLTPDQILDLLTSDDPAGS